MAESEPKTVIVENLADMRVVNNLEVQMAELSRDMVHLASCFQEMNARLEEFMKTQEERVRYLEQNCNREERWNNNKTDHSLLWDEIKSLDTRLVAIERAKCPKLPVFEDYGRRISEIEKKHHIDSGVSTSIVSFREYAAWILSFILGMIALYQFFKGV